MPITAAPPPHPVVGKHLAELYQGCSFWVQIGELWHHLEAISPVQQQPYMNPSTGENRVLLMLNARTINPSPGEAQQMGFQQWADPLPPVPGFWVDPSKYDPPPPRKSRKRLISKR